MGKINEFFENNDSEENHLEKRLVLFWDGGKGGRLFNIQKQVGVNAHSKSALNSYSYQADTLASVYRLCNREAAENFNIKILEKFLKETGNIINISVKHGDIGDKYHHEFVITHPKKEDLSKGISYSTSKIDIEEGFNIIAKGYDREARFYDGAAIKRSGPKRS